MTESKTFKLTQAMIHAGDVTNPGGAPDAPSWFLERAQESRGQIVLAWGLLRRGKFEEALRFLEQLTLMYPEDSQVFRTFALALERSGQKDIAEEVRRYAATLDNGSRSLPAPSSSSRKTLDNTGSTPWCDSEFEEVTQTQGVDATWMSAESEEPFERGVVQLGRVTEQALHITDEIEKIAPGEFADHSSFDRQTHVGEALRGAWASSWGGRLAPKVGRALFVSVVVVGVVLGGAFVVLTAGADHVTEQGLRAQLEGGDLVSLAELVDQGEVPADPPLEYYAAQAILYRFFDAGPKRLDLLRGDAAQSQVLSGALTAGGAQRFRWLNKMASLPDSAMPRWFVGTTLFAGGSPSAADPMLSRTIDDPHTAPYVLAAVAYHYSIRGDAKMVERVASKVSHRGGPYARFVRFLAKPVSKVPDLHEVPVLMAQAAMVRALRAPEGSSLRQRSLRAAVGHFRGGITHLLESVDHALYQENIDVARTLLEANVFPRGPAVAAAWGRLALLVGDLPAARDSLSEAKRGGSTDPRVGLAMVEVARRSGDGRLGPKRLLERVYQSWPDSEVVAYNLAETSLASEPAVAARVLRKTLRFTPLEDGRRNEALFLLAKAELVRGRTAESGRLAKEVLASDTGHTGAKELLDSMSEP